MAYCYILRSDSLNNKFYIGSTIDEPPARLKKHLNQTYGGQKYTAKAKTGKSIL